MLSAHRKNNSQTCGSCATVVVNLSNLGTPIRKILACGPFVCVMALFKVAVVVVCAYEVLNENASAFLQRTPGRSTGDPVQNQCAVL